MSASGAASSVPALVPAARRPSRYESQKRRDWQTFVRYLAAHRPPLLLRRCSGAHVLEFLRYLDRFGKTRVHAPPCPAYGVRATTTTALAPCQCPLQQAWGSLDALVGRLRAAFDERHGARGDHQQHDASFCNPFAARAVRLYLRDVRDAQSRARGISYHKKKKKRKLAAGCIKEAASSSKNGGGMDVDADGERQQPGPLRGHKTTTTTMTALANAAPVPPLLPPLPPCLAGVPFEYCDTGSLVASGPGCYGGVYLPLLFNAFT
ncbi:hypothetical protein QYE76_042433 [Lolium multiflorum]|uniref:ALOG domain-containing protein n=1 Tax=Lolium multiflorum TaxID=4521 RepID=A0AAD8WUX6_LOLMU|nr:hypothetical protein QYE76_042433 [Lolium multiflorum]